MTEQLDIPREVVNNENVRHTVMSVMLKPKDGEAFKIAIDLFNKRYVEYVDPKDLEIQRLKQELSALKEKHKPVRKKKRTLTKGELLEVEELISRGEDNTSLATQYDMSDSAISRIRLRMRKAGEDV